MARIRMAVLELVGYREWTEAIGDDREWRLQIVQSTLYSSLQQVIADYGGFILPLRYDYMAVAASNVSDEGLKRLYDKAREISPVPVRLAASCGSTPVEAMENAWTRIKEGEEFVLDECGDNEIVVAGHFDLNGITVMTRRLGLLTTYNTVLHVISEIETRAHYRGAVAQYLGGDNILVLLPFTGFKSIVEELVVVHDLKAGVGIAPTAREALKHAAKALHDIRTGKAGDRIRVEGAHYET
ncbi:MAG: GTP cyclohydrolase IIa [Desulfurococcales archaeon]|nr:GTP cyclohydrolase IIa [Desulfurococcales archaeon]